MSSYVVEGRAMWSHLLKPFDVFGNDCYQIYINAVQLLTGSAGWPLNVITLPDGRPVWGGTYFKKEDWTNILEQIQKIYTENPEKLYEVANNLEQGIKNMQTLLINRFDYIRSTYIPQSSGASNTSTLNLRVS